MSESILTPIMLGFMINTIVFAVTYFIFKNTVKATHFTLGAALLVLISSFIVGQWLGMGMGVISMGMFLASVVFYLLNLTCKR
ncbi:YesK family protein [Ureibacillus thermosphaericus]|uniref:YesK family protein n=1 Tax=Ureibacillus thermosphaericus TaxID=51173 RepID=UPI000BBBA91A|nr:YesK family protein [Ureibacillus thermosphaericus]